MDNDSGVPLVEESLTQASVQSPCQPFSQWMTNPALPAWTPPWDARTPIQIVKMIVLTIFEIDIHHTHTEYSQGRIEAEGGAFGGSMRPWYRQYKQIRLLQLLPDCVHT